MDRLLTILLGIIQSEPNNSIDCILATYLLQHIQDIHSITTDDLALHTQISKSSISRFCRKIGLNNFYELREMIRMYDSSLEKFNFFPISKYTSLSKQYIETVSQHILNLCDSLDFSMIDELVDDLMAYENVIIAGNLQANSIAHNLQLNLFSCHKLVQSKVKFSQLCQLIEEADHNTLIITFSTKGSFFRRMFLQDRRLLKKDQPKIYLISENKNMALSPYIDRLIYVDGHLIFQVAHFN